MTHKVLSLIWENLLVFLVVFSVAGWAATCAARRLVLYLMARRIAKTIRERKPTEHQGEVP